MRESESEKDRGGRTTTVDSYKSVRIQTRAVAAAAAAAATATGRTCRLALCRPVRFAPRSSCRRFSLLSFLFLVADPRLSRGISPLPLSDFEARPYCILGPRLSHRVLVAVVLVVVVRRRRRRCSRSRRRDAVGSTNTTAHAHAHTQPRYKSSARHQSNRAFATRPLLRSRSICRRRWDNRFVFVPGYTASVRY